MNQSQRMTILRYILRLFVVMLFSTLGASMAFAIPTNTSENLLYQADNTLLSEANDVGFTARAPPLAVSNIEVTGSITVMHGSAFVTDGAETQWASLNFGADLVAPNNVPNLVIDTKIQTQMADRGWSRQNIDDVIADGPAGRTTDNRRPNKTDDGLGRNDTATVYGSSGNYVIVNDRTGEIVQVSGRNDPNWIDDGRIQWD